MRLKSGNRRVLACTRRSIKKIKKLLNILNIINFKYRFLNISLNINFIIYNFLFIIKFIKIF